MRTIRPMIAPLLLASFLVGCLTLFFLLTSRAAEPSKFSFLFQSTNVSTNPVFSSPRLLTNSVVVRPGGRLAPGVYSAKPYSMLVLVPELVDQDMIHLPPSNATFSGRIIQPPFRLEPLSRK